MFLNQIKKNVMFILGLVVILMASSPIFAQNQFALARYNTNGSLDNTFGDHGMVLTDFASSTSTSFEAANAVVAQTYALPSFPTPWGRSRLRIQVITAVGYAHISGGDQFALAQYNWDGSLRRSILTDFTRSTSEEATAIAIQSDGKIVVAGYAHISGGDQFALARYNSWNLLLDDTFGDGGQVLTDIRPSSSERANAIRIQADGKIVIAGHADDQFALVRYSPNGQPDRMFNGDGNDDGIIVTNFTPSTSEEVNAIAIQTDGKIVVAGQIGRQFALARYNSDGRLDRMFNGDGNDDGIIITSFGGPLSTYSESAKAVALQVDRKIVVAGFGDGFVLARYNLDGRLDRMFDVTDFPERSVSGSLSRSSSRSNGANAIAIQADGKIVAAGQDYGRFALARYNVDGRLDRMFNGDGNDDGMIVTDFTSSLFEEANAIVLQEDGKIVVAGKASRGSTSPPSPPVRETPPPPTERASYTYTCTPVENDDDIPFGIRFTVRGSNFPPRSNVSLMPQFSGIFRSFTGPIICGSDLHPSDGRFGPFPVDDEGDFEVTITVRFGCQPTCSVRVIVTSSVLTAGSINFPPGPDCGCG